MIQPYTVPGTAGDWGPATMASAEPQGRWGSLNVSGASGAEPLLSDNTRDKTPANDENTQQNPSLQQRKTASLTRTCQRPNAAAVLGVPSDRATACSAPTTNRNSDLWIAVADAETLRKIGHDPKFPLNGKYRQTGYIDGRQLPEPIGNDTHPFTGILRHENGTVCNLANCLMKRLGDEGEVDGLIFYDANIRSKGPVAVAACTISDDAMVRNIYVINARVEALSDHAGIAGGDVWGTVVNTTAVNCEVVVSGDEAGAAGIGAGTLHGSGMVADTTAVNCTVTTAQCQPAGIGAGDFIEGREEGDLRDGHGTVANTTAVDCQVITAGSRGAGIGVGFHNNYRGTVANTTAVNCKVTNSDGPSAVGAGYLSLEGKVTNTTAVNCEIINLGTDIYSCAGIGAGMARAFDTVADTTAVNCRLVTSGKQGYAGIGVGEALGGTVTDTTAVNCTVATSGSEGRAGIGAGWPIIGPITVANTTAVNCNVTTSGQDGDAGIAAGRVGAGYDLDDIKIANTTALNCTVATSGKDANAGLGVGRPHSQFPIARTTGINCEVDSLTGYGEADVSGGPAPNICNVRINGHRQNNTAHGCDFSPDNLCAGIGHPLLAPDCRPDDNFAALIRSNTHEFGLCPATATIIPPISGKSGDSRASGLTNAAMAGIALGGVLFLLIGVGLCLYRYYSHRASSRATGHHSAGQRQGGSNPGRGSDDIQRHQRSLVDPAQGDNQKVSLISKKTL
ncbi:hypothetical protein [Endozoicomonas sp. ONNA2]|uniref:hypothetical protein n=1 Tax=Endozoicomonas sp. ONNA2 TaxID=2828741 RepID=UPI002149057C|nr:hypothetical protein [Endozoicomonas sp. ONNA2]